MTRKKLITKSLSSKAWLLMLGLVFAGLSCQKEDFEPLEEPRSTLRRIVTHADIPGVVTTLREKMGMPEEATLFSANRGESESLLSIDWDRIKQLIDTTGRETYAFGINDTETDPHVFYNLIFRYSENKEAHQPFILKYTMDEDFLSEYLQTNSLEDFRGKVQKILLKDPLSNNHLQGRAALGGDEGGITVGEPCPNETPVNGGGNDSGSGGSLPTYECSSYLVTTTWYSQACSPSGCEPPVEIGQEQSIVTECGWVNENEVAGSDSDCDPETGEIPIIQPDGLTTFICNKNIKFKATGDAQTAQISGLGLTVVHPRTFKIKLVELGIVCVTIPRSNYNSANLIFTTAYNKAVIDFTTALNSGSYGPNPLTSTLKSKLKQAVVKNIAAQSGVSSRMVRFSTGLCVGGIPNTVAEYCKTD